MKNLKENKVKSVLPVIRLLSNENIDQKPSKIPSPSEIKKLTISHGITASIPNIFRPGFILNAHDPVAPGKAKLIVTNNRNLHNIYVNDCFPPYYYQFTRYQAVWDYRWANIKIHFEPAYAIQEGYVFVRVGGYRVKGNISKYIYDIGGAPIFIETEHDSDEYGFVSQTLKLYIPPAGNQLRNALEITVGSTLESWKFFDARYNPAV